MREGQQRCNKHNFVWKFCPNVSQCPLCEHEERQAKRKETMSTFKEMSNRKVKRLWWSGANGDESATPKEGERFFFQHEYFGDHAENWIIVYDKDDHEIRRYNTAYIAEIQWEDE